jgi:hypothetical protein
MGLDILVCPVGTAKKDVDSCFDAADIGIYLSKLNNTSVILCPNPDVRVIDYMPHNQHEWRSCHGQTVDFLVMYLEALRDSMIDDLETFVYPANFKKYWTDKRLDSEINLKSDLKILEAFIASLKKAVNKGLLTKDQLILMDC